MPINFDWKDSYYYLDNRYYDTCEVNYQCYTTVEQSEQYKLKMKFDELTERLHDKGYISIGFLCNVMGFECDNPYEFYCGDKDKWLKDMIEELHEIPLQEATIQIIAALHEQYKDGEED